LITTVEVDGRTAIVELDGRIDDVTIISDVDAGLTVEVIVDKIFVSTEPPGAVDTMVFVTTDTEGWMIDVRVTVLTAADGGLIVVVIVVGFDCPGRVVVVVIVLTVGIAGRIVDVIVER
jgi:hypothetical protein